jgi:HK97 gp10 family phage protein
MADQPKIEGMDKLVRSLSTLPARVRRRALKAIVKAGNKVIKAELQQKAEAVQRQGTYYRSIGDKDKVYGDIGVGLVGPRRDFNEPKVYDSGEPAKKKDGTQIVQIPDNYDHLIEFGTEDTQAHPIIRETYDAKGQDAIREMERVGWDEIIAIVNGMN